MGVNESLTFSGATGGGGGPTKHEAIARDDPDVLVTATRARNRDGDWEVRGYDVYGDDIYFRGLDRRRAHVAAIIVEVFEGAELHDTTRQGHSTHPMRDGVPPVVAADGKPAVAAWLHVRGDPRGEIADVLGVSTATITEYLSRFRSRGEGLPDDPDLPSVGDAMAEVPAKFRPKEAA